MGIIRRLKHNWWLVRQRTAYHLWIRWRGGHLLEAPVGEMQKVKYNTDDPDGFTSENMWATKLGRDLYELENNGFFTPVAKGDIVRVKVKWPFLEVVEVVERKRRTARIYFDLPWPDKAERTRIREAVLSKGGEMEWGYPYLLTVSFDKDTDPYEVLGGTLKGNARILEIDS